MRVSSAVGEKKLTSSLPSYLNYLEKGFVSKVQNQGNCGSCWAFGSVAYYESQLLMQGKSY